MARDAAERSHWDGYDYVRPIDEVEQRLESVRTILGGSAAAFAADWLIGLIRRLKR
jgi:hypothetical protein